MGVTKNTGRKLGEGSFGVVYEAIHKVTGDTVVVKELKGTDQAAEVAFIHEVSLLKSFHHPNVLGFIGLLCHGARETEPFHHTHLIVVI